MCPVCWKTFAVSHLATVFRPNHKHLFIGVLHDVIERLEIVDNRMVECLKPLLYIYMLTVIMNSAIDTVGRKDIAEE